jgi:hypothetical protein
MLLLCVYMQIWDESDRLSSYVEARAKATLVKYTRRYCTHAY